MFNKEVVVRCESGLHNRQATYFVQKANEFESSIWLESGSRRMNAKSLLGIMSLGVVTGTTVTLSASGPMRSPPSTPWMNCSRGTCIKIFAYLAASMPQALGRYFLALVRGRP